METDLSHAPHAFLPRNATMGDCYVHQADLAKRQHSKPQQSYEPLAEAAMLSSGCHSPDVCFTELEESKKCTLLQPGRHFFGYISRQSSL